MQRRSEDRNAPRAACCGALQLAHFTSRADLARCGGADVIAKGPENARRALLGALMTYSQGVETFRNTMLSGLTRIHVPEISVSSQSFGVSLSNYYERKQKEDPTVNISSYRSFNWAFHVHGCYSSVQTTARNQP